MDPRLVEHWQGTGVETYGVEAFGYDHPIGWSYQKLMFDEMMWTYLKDGPNNNNTIHVDVDDEKDNDWRPNDVILEIEYKGTVYESEDFMHDPTLYKLFVEERAASWKYKYFDFRSIQPVLVPKDDDNEQHLDGRTTIPSPQQCEW